MDDSELNAIRAARLAELQKNTGGGDGQPVSKQDEIKSSMLSQLLEVEARERLSRVRIVRPERANSVEQYIMKLYSMGQITKKLTEQDIVQILDGISRDEVSNSKSQIIFDRRHKINAGDDDDIDDDDDDFFD